MSLLDQLWDDTVAGPRPENGLGKLRKYPTFSFRSSSGKEIPEAEGVMVRSYGDDAAAERIRVTRSITIVKPQGNPNGSPPISPASSSPPVSPFGDVNMVGYVDQEGKNPTGFVGGLHRMRTRKQVELDPGALLLLTTCEI
ncbi:dormancy-associated protein homolog 3-like isoform X1 [Cornus florida]|uniref:dormancy-associated protein homolog 3-like isoform X1 n=1 Tax=Cornus florida TaxID=4283 RepID=UPI0028A2498E|nr:dormancy-associated protein homolog 3-like isoform X1 [Cornus florida]